MSDKTGIGWTDATWSPLVGCTHVSAGCDHCYAASLASGRLSTHPIYAGLAVGGRFTGEVRLLPERLDQPLRWRKPRRIFVNSMSDLFHDEVPDEFIAQVFGVMALTPRHAFQILTKRPGRMASLLNRDSFELAVRAEVQRQKWSVLGTEAPPWSWPLGNCWLGTSVEDQKWANVRIPQLVRVPAAVRFLSVEPLLAPVDLWPWINPEQSQGRIGWVIVGGESGPDHRPIQAEWVRGLRDQCVAAGVAFFFKQWGGRTPKTGGRLLDGHHWDEYPRVDGSQVVRVGHRVSPEASDRALQLRLGLP
jgi:protein gp37